MRRGLTARGYSSLRLPPAVRPSPTSAGAATAAARPVPLSQLRPRPILEWQRILSLPAPPSRTLLQKLEAAFQAPLPPLRQRHAWIQAGDVQNALKHALLPEMVGEESRSTLDAIIAGSRRYLEDAKKRAEVHIRQSCMEHGLELSQDDLQRRIDSQREVAAWSAFLESSILGQARVKVASHSFRRPLEEALKEALSSYIQANSRSREVALRILHLIVRIFPSINEESKRKRFLDSNVLARQLLPIIPGQAKASDAEDALDNLQVALRSDALDMPQDLVHLFGSVQDDLCSRIDPDPSLYAVALAMDTKVAPWRAILPTTSENVFEPTIGLVQAVAEMGCLNTSHLNTLMWAIFRQEPGEIDGKDVAEAANWPSIALCLEIYDAMRGNAVQIEMEWLQRQMRLPGSSLLGYGQKISAACPILGLKGELPRHIVPDQKTFELLIRGLTWQADLRRAVSILHDMTQSSVDTSLRWKQLQKGDFSADQGEPEEATASSTFEATPATFDSFFRGFCKHGVPSILIDFDREEPDKSEWEPMNSAEEDENSEWTTISFLGFLETYLQLNPQSCRLALREYPNNPTVKRQDKDSLQPTKGEEISSSSNLALMSDDYQQMWHSIDSLVDPPSDLYMHSCPAPTPQQLFNVLTALRRMSNDDPFWVLTQWQRIVDKFGPTHSKAVGRHRSTNPKEITNHEGWSNWRLNNRIQRVLAHLQDML